MNARILSLGVALAACLVAAGRTEYTVQPVVDIPVDGRAWDLSRCEPVGGEVDYRVDADGGRTRVWSPVKRFDFAVTAGDTLLQTCAETRAYRALFIPGILRGMPGGAGGAGRFSFNGRIYQTEFVIGDGTSVVEPVVTGVLTDNTGEELAGAVLHHDIVTMRWHVSRDSMLDIASVPDTLIYTTVADNYRIMAPYESFPRAFKRVNTVLCEGKVVSRDSTAWVMSFSPSVEAERARRTRLLPGGYDWADRLEFEPGGEVKVVVSDNGVVVTSGAETKAAVVITDILGRVYYERGMTLTPSGTDIPIDGLPGGEYLLQVVPDGGEVTAVKFKR